MKNRISSVRTMKETLPTTRSILSTEGCAAPDGKLTTAMENKMKIGSVTMN